MIIPLLGWLTSFAYERGPRLEHGHRPLDWLHTSDTVYSGSILLCTAMFRTYALLGAATPLVLPLLLFSHCI